MDALQERYGALGAADVEDREARGGRVEGAVRERQPLGVCGYEPRPRVGPLPGPLATSSSRVQGRTAAASSSGLIAREVIGAKKA
jgi:hypothetical protein